jgi:hypothetical protein
MQLPQLFRRGIVVPLTDHSAEQLSRGSVDDFVAVGFVPIVSQSLFDEIWEAGLFQSLNSVCSTLIDDYEEEELQPEQLERAIASLAASRHRVMKPGVELFLENLIMLCRSAREKHRSVHFVL